MKTHGTFKAELWDEDDYVITCSVGPIGQTVSQHDAKRMAEWLNGAVPELLRKLNDEPVPEGEQ